MPAHPGQTNHYFCIKLITEALTRNTCKTKVDRDIRRNLGNSWKRQLYSGKLLELLELIKIADN